MSADQSPFARLKAAIRRRVSPGSTSGTPAAPRRPVFVLGNQKAGTTAIAALLAECIDEPFNTDALHVNKLELKDLLQGETTIADLARNHPEPFQATVIKDNDFTFLYPPLAEAFPDAQFLYIVRDPRHNIRSILNRVKFPGDLDGLSEEQYAQLGRKLPGWHTILTGASFGQDRGHYIDVLADRWVRAVEAYLDAPDQMTLLRYEDFEADKRPAIEQLATDLGFPVVKDISERQDHQFQPRGNRTVTPLEFFGRDNLERIESRCGALMPRFGYDLTP